MSATTSPALPLSEVARALEALWAEIRGNHPDVPDVAIVVASGASPRGLNWGHFAGDRWQVGEGRLPEVLIGGEGLQREPEEVLVTALHEAAHGVARTRGIDDTSREGRYHNGRFAALARELGLVPEQDKRIGWSPCTLAPGTLDRYVGSVGRLRTAVRGYRHAEYGPGAAGKDPDAEKSDRNGIRCWCECGRSFRIARTMFTQGDITCDCCGQPFRPKEDLGEDLQDDE